MTNEKDKFKKYENIIFTNSIDEVYKEHTKRNLDNLFVIGGNEIYKISRSNILALTPSSIGASIAQW